ncbi:MAG: hypothetical protein S0880_11870 [Actinomycetota bacterium]|nr:hypothetical protein [Actinomycetota bacterium]
MPTLSFEGDSHADLVAQVRRWLESVGEPVPAAEAPEPRLSPAEAIEQGATLTKDALRLVAQSAPEPVAQHELFKALTDMGYRATDATRTALVEGLDSVAELTGEAVVRRAAEAGRSAVYEMNINVAREVLKRLSGA